MINPIVRIGFLSFPPFRNWPHFLTLLPSLLALLSMFIHTAINKCFFCFSSYRNNTWTSHFGVVSVFFLSSRISAETDGCSSWACFCWKFLSEQGSCFFSLSAPCCSGWEILITFTDWHFLLYFMQMYYSRKWSGYNWILVCIWIRFTSRQ